MSEDFAIFIITHGRPNNQLTTAALHNAGYTGKIYYVLDDEDTTIADYVKLYGKENIKIFNKDLVKFDLGDNFSGYRGVPVYARNVCFGFARELGLKYFAEFDDDYPKIDARIPINNKLGTAQINNLDGIIESVCEFLSIPNIYCVAFAVEGDFLGGLGNKKVADGYYRNARNSFFCNVDKPFDFFGRICEDVSVPVWYNQRGQVFITLTSIRVHMLDHTKNTGGSSEHYTQTNWYWCYFYPIMYCPNCISMTTPDMQYFIKHVNTQASVTQIVSDKYKVR